MGDKQIASIKVNNVFLLNAVFDRSFDQFVAEERRFGKIGVNKVRNLNNFD